MFLLEALLCPVALFRSKGRRFTYSIFLVSQLLLTARSVTGIVYIFIENNAYATEPPLDALLLCNLIIDICRKVGQAFLFVAIVYLILDRHEAIDRAAGGQIGHIDSRMPLVHYTLFMGTVALGIVSSIFAERFDNKLWKDYFELHPKDQSKEYNQMQKLSYIYQAFWDSAGLYLLFFIAITYTAMVSVKVNDKVVNLVLFVLAPLQVCEIIFGVVFTIVLSPVGPEYAQTSTGNLQFSIANTALTNACLIGMGTVLLLPGLRADWGIKRLKAEEQDDQMSRYSKLSAPPAYDKGSYASI